MNTENTIINGNEKFGFRRELHHRDREAEFWPWIEKEEHGDKILELLLTPGQNEAEIERRNAGKSEKFLAYHEPPPVSPRIGWYRLVTPSIG